jgi:WD40 repeat protein
MPVRLVVLLTTACAAPSLVAVDSPDRRSRYEPEVAVRDGGRSGACDAVRFSPDGRFLFAAGDDKVVTVWEHADAGLNTAPNKVRALRWPAWREQRGGIKDAAVSPDGTRVLVGGYGLRIASVAILDREPAKDGAPGRVALTWPKTRPGRDSFRTVQAVAFNSDGKAAAFATEDGSVWVWVPAELKQADDAGRWWNTPRWVGKRPGDPPRLIAFRRTDAELVALSASGRVTAYDVSNPAALPESPPDRVEPVKPLLELGDEKAPLEVFHAAYDARHDRLAVAVHKRPRVIVRPLAPGRPAVELVLPKEHFARTVAVDPKTGAVAVAVGTVVPATPGDPQFHNDADDEVRVYRDPTDAKPAAVLTVRGQAEALAFHPTADRLAVGGGDADEVTLYDLKAGRPLSVARGGGRRPWAVALSPNGNLVGVRTGRDPKADRPNRRGAGGWTGFNLQTLQPLRDPDQPWVGAKEEADGWSVVPDAKDRDLWYAAHTDGRRLPLQHDRLLFNKPTCYTFLPATAKTPTTRLLVGHYHGATLYDLPNGRADGPLPPTRIHLGHAGEVLSVAAVDDPPDGKGGWFVTGGADHTVAAYSLRAWDHHPHLGATFARTAAGGVMVKDVAVGSPGWEAGLRAGETLELLVTSGKGGTKWVYDRRRVAAGKPEVNESSSPTTEFRPAGGEVGDAAAAVAALANPPPKESLAFGVRSAAGEYRELNTTVVQRPLWKLWLGYDDRPAPAVNDWVIWMWKGSYFHTDSTEGDRKVGWHVNGPTTRDPPQFFAMSQFADAITDRTGKEVPLLGGAHGKNVLRTLLRTRDVKAALADALGDDPQAPAVNFYAPDLSRALPVPVAVTADSNTVTARPETVTVTVHPLGRDIDLLPERVELWVNDHRYKAWTLQPGRTFSEPVTLDPAVLRTGANQLTALTFNPGRGRGEARHTLTYEPTTPRRPTALGLAVGINDYKAHQAAVKRGGDRGGKELPNLACATRDAAALAAALSKATAADPRRFELVLDAAATRAAILAKLDDLPKRVSSPDDVLVLFVAAHGDLFLRPAGAGTPGGRAGRVTDRFVICCPDYDPANADATSVSADELVQKLAEVNCRKVVLLDLCHSGGAVEANVLRRMIPNGQAPFVIASCDQSESAFEDPAAGHGLFTAAILDALGPGFQAADRDPADDRLSGKELFAHIGRRLPDLLVRAGKPGIRQTPVCYPPADPAFVILTRVVSK